MTRTSITNLKARLSAFLDIVRHGEEVLVTDRGRPIARLSPVVGEEREQSRREQLIRDGRLRPPTPPISRGVRWPPCSRSGAKGCEVLGLVRARATGARATSHGGGATHAG